MRVMTLVVTVLVAVVGLAGCTSDSEPDPKPEPTGPTPVMINVFLSDEATEEHKQAIQARLHEVPGASEITFETREQAYERFKDVFEDDPELLEHVTPESLPESFRFTLADRAGADPLIDELGELPGVDEVAKQPEPTPSTR